MWNVLQNISWWGSKNHPPVNDAQRPCRKISNVCDPITKKCKVNGLLFITWISYWPYSICNKATRIPKNIELITTGGSIEQRHISLNQSNTYLIRYSTMRKHASISTHQRNTRRVTDKEKRISHKLPTTGAYQVYYTIAILQLHYSYTI